MLNTAPRVSISRRHVLAGAGALAASAAMPRFGLAASAPKYRRWNISDPDCPPRVLDSYKKAVRAMLALPPTDPRNWYRYTLIHTLDCPHGNWWFLPWHRGYVGWFEEICRDLSGDPEFALPYWDWTKEPRVPKAMFDDVLNPNDGAFISSASAFKAQFRDAVANGKYWDTVKNADGSISPSPQYAQLLNRSIRFPDDLWFDIIDSPAGAMFFNQPNARGLSAAQPGLTIPNAPPEKQSVLKAVSLSMILDALSPRDFMSFGSPKALAHSFSSGFGVLESQPHNLVHNCVGGTYNKVGGFMQAFMSPTDPLFYLHHTNIDRLWDVWTRKQLARKYPTLPDGYLDAVGQAPKPGSDYAAWATEPFVFFIDAKGAPVQQTTAGAYANIGDFDYDYSPGSGEEIVPSVPPAEVAATPREPLLASLTTRRVGEQIVSAGSVTVPLDLVRQQAEPLQRKLFASVTVNLPPQSHNDLDVLVGSAGSGPPQFVASLSMFGHHVMQGPVTFLVPLSTALAKLQTDRKFEESPQLDIQVVPREKDEGMTPMAHHVEAKALGAAASAVTEISLKQL